MKENEFKVPQVMIDDEIRGMVVRYGLAGRGVTDPAKVNVDFFREHLKEQALNRIRCSIIIDKIAELEDVKIEETDREQLIQRIAQENGTAPDQVRRLMADERRALPLLLEIRRTKTLEFLVGSAEVAFKAAEKPK